MTTSTTENQMAKPSTAHDATAADSDQKDGTVIIATVTGTSRSRRRRRRIQGDWGFCLCRHLRLIDDRGVCCSCRKPTEIKVMSYREENGQITLTMTREDYQLLLIALGMAIGASLQGRGQLSYRVIAPLLNRLNAGNPNYRRYVLESQQ